jgi:hypothetical protein
MVPFFAQPKDKFSMAFITIICTPLLEETGRLNLYRGHGSSKSGTLLYFYFFDRVAAIQGALTSLQAERFRDSRAHRYRSLRSCV